MRSVLLPSNDGASAAKSLGPEHRSRDAIVRALILLDEMAKVFRLMHVDAHALGGTHADDHCCVVAALVRRDLSAHAVQLDGAFEEAPCCSEITVRPQHEADREAAAVNRSVQVLSVAVDLDVAFVHAPACADRALVPTKLHSKNRYRS